MQSTILQLGRASLVMLQNTHEALLAMTEDAIIRTIAHAVAQPMEDLD